MLCYADSHQTSSRSRPQVPAVACEFPRPDRIMDETTEDISTLPPPPLWRHCMAMLYDTLLVIPLFMAAAGVWVAVLGPTDSISEPAVPAYLQWCSWLVILIAFFGVFWRRAGQTLGMQAWRIKLITDSGEPLSWRSVILRVVGAFIAASPFAAGYLWRYVRPHRLYWHDSLSGTRLVCLPKKGG